MIWSFSNSKMFNQCQRQWYLKNFVASHNAKTPPVRREAYLLSKLSSVWAWRGKLVDKVISERIVRTLANDWSLNASNILGYARELFQKQLAFASNHRLREPGMTVSKFKDEFAAFHAVEYGKEISQEGIKRAWVDVEQALLNLLGMDELLSLLRSTDNLIAQRPLQFRFEAFHRVPVTVKAVPDLIAFFGARPPLIVDWKVHTFGSTDYRLQLATYAIALTRCNSHKDFPISLSQYSATDMQLLEVQLLTNRQRAYTLTDTDIHEVDSYIAGTASRMDLTMGDKTDKQFTPFDFPATNYPQVCERCPFQSICWDEVVWQE